MPDLDLREATPGDLASVAELWARLDAFHREMGLAFPEPEEAAKAWVASFERTLGRFSFLWVAETGGEVVAFLLARLKRVPAYLGGVSVGEISDLYVAESLRGQGVGARLAALAVEKLNSQEVHSIEVQIMARNQGGLDFWLEQGFEQELTQVRLIIGGEADGHA